MLYFRWIGPEPNCLLAVFLLPVNNKVEFFFAKYFMKN